MEPDPNLQKRKTFFFHSIFLFWVFPFRTNNKSAFSNPGLS